MTEQAFDPKLIQTVLDEAKALSSGESNPEEPLGLKSPLLEFTEQAFDQTFRSALEIGVPDFTQSGKEEVLALASEKNPDDTVSSLLNLYVDVCNIWPDVLSETYGGSTADFLDFRTDLIPSLLSELETFATERKEASLAEVLKGARASYAKALRKAS